jgi:cell division initiation protein
MTYTPVELRHVKVGRSLFGYNRATVEQLLEEVAQSFETTWRERGELSDKVESLEKQLDDLRGREHLLTQTLVAAEQAASDVREQARREAEAIISEAHIESRAIARAAHAQRETLLIEARRVEAMLRAALGVMEDGRPAAPSISGVERAVPEPAPVPLPPVLDDDRGESDAAMPWGRDDTREFEPVGAAPAVPSVAAAEPDHSRTEAEESDEPAPEPVLERVPGRESRDFDWGE